MNLISNPALRTAVLGGGDPSLTFHQVFAGATSLAQARRKGPVLTYTRADTVATYFDSSGVLQTATTDEPRFDHNLSGTALGLLIEESRINRALWNRDHTNAAWVATTMTQAKDATGLDGVANSATTLTATAGNATSLQTVTIASAAFTFSIYVKRVTGTGNIDITIDNGLTWTTLTGLSSSAWTRHDVTQTLANPVFGVRIVTSGDAVEVDFAQLEPGAFRTSPNATTTAAVTRAADLASTGTSGVLLSFINPAAMTWFASASAHTVNTGAVRMIFTAISASQAAARPKFDLRAHNSASQWQYHQTQIDGTDALLASANNDTADTIHKSVVAYDASTEGLSFDGALDDTTFSNPQKMETGFDIFYVGHNNGTSHWNGHIQEIKGWNVRKADSFGQAQSQ